MVDNNSRSTNEDERGEGHWSQEKLLQTSELFEGRREICLEHEGAIYRLRITKAGKLILNK